MKRGKLRQIYLDIQKTKGKRHKKVADKGSNRFIDKDNQPCNSTNITGSQRLNPI